MIKKNIIITGITKGIGLAIAKKFFQNNFHVIGCSSQLENVQNLKTEFPEMELYTVDMKNEQEIKNFVNTISQNHKQIEILVNNAGKFIPGQIHAEKNEVFQEMIAVNLNSAYFMTKETLPLMLPFKHGTIFNICSTASITPYINGGSYCISKYALMGLTKVLREEMKDFNIRVTAILPGATLTNSWAGTDLNEDRFIGAADLAELIFTTYSLPQTSVVEELLVRPILGDI